MLVPALSLVGGSAGISELVGSVLLESFCKSWLNKGKPQVSMVSIPF
uniref:Uncharacterized protein n=1 Tax=Arundo donax TaxID=35708 RepID=A0A0A9EL24_ARUDO